MHYLISLLILFAVALFVTLVTHTTSSSDPKESRPNLGARTLLIFLRLAIGWHFLIEGVEKINDPNWSSAGYLRGSTGPLADNFRDKGTADLFAKLTPTDDGKFPAALDAEWQRYFDAFTNQYGLTTEQLEEATKKFEEAKPNLIKEQIKEEQDKLNLMKDQIEKAKLLFDQSKDKTLKWIKDKSWVNLYSPYMKADDRKKEMTVAERIKYYHDTVARLEMVEEEEVPIHGDGVKDKVTHLYSEAKQIADLLKTDLDKQFSGTEPGKEGLRTLLVGLIKDRQKTDYPPPPEHAPPPPVTEWTELNWADNIVRWGLVVVGLCLLGGLLTRPACVLGAFFVLMFFLALPPLPGWPDNPKAEGHYLFINKNIIEMMALLALAFMPTGRWFGLDGLLQFVNPFARTKTTPSQRPAPRTGTGPVREPSKFQPSSSVKET